MKRNNNNNNNNTFLQEIWKIHTDVQEQMLQLRSVPVRVVAESAKIVDEKLYLRIDENDKTDSFLESIGKLFNIDSTLINLTNGYIYVDINEAKNISFSQKNELTEKASVNFIEFLPNPIIDGYINKLKSPVSDLQDLMRKSNFEYDFDRKGRLQITIKDLKQLNKIYSDQNTPIQIPEKSSIIIPIYPNPLYFLKKEFPFLNVTHKTKQSRKKRMDNKILWNRTIEVSGGYFKEEVLKRLKEGFGLSLLSYDFVFYINPKVIDKYNPETSPHVLPKFNKQNNSFLFHTNFKLYSNESRRYNSYDEERQDYSLKYKRLNKFFRNVFGANNIRFEPRFIYEYDLYKFTTEFLPTKEYNREDFWQELFNSNIDEAVSISENAESIGIDFDWKVEKIEDVLLNFINKTPIFNFHLFNDHKCNIDFQIQDISLDESEAQLREKFPSIKTKKDNRNGTLYFYQEYQSNEQAIMLKDMIQTELNIFDTNIYDVELYDIPKNKEKYILTIDHLAKKESQASAINEIRGADFSVNGNRFGKLFRVKFPEMVFDISGVSFEENKLLFKTKKVDTIEPNLTGDIEKIHRLKSSLDNIVNGNNLQNPNLKDFIFVINS